MTPDASPRSATEGDHHRVPPPIGTPTGQTSRLDLRGMARTIQQAAVEEDLDMLHRELCRLRNALIEHLHGNHDPQGPIAEGRDPRRA